MCAIQTRQKWNFWKVACERFFHREYKILYNVCLILSYAFMCLSHYRNAFSLNRISKSFASKKICSRHAALVCARRYVIPLQVSFSFHQGIFTLGGRRLRDPPPVTPTPPHNPSPPSQFKTVLIFSQSPFKESFRWVIGSSDICMARENGFLAELER